MHEVVVSARSVFTSSQDQCPMAASNRLVDMSFLKSCPTDFGVATKPAGAWPNRIRLTFSGTFHDGKSLGSVYTLQRKR